MDESRTLHVGVIGAGFSARLHAEAYRQVRGVDGVLAQVATARPERAARFAEEFGVGAVATSAEEVLVAADVDVVDLCMPTAPHAPLAISAARAGKQVIVEKPLTGCSAPPATQRAEMVRRALASGGEILAACREAGVRLCYAENWVYAPPIQRAGRRALPEGRRGAPAARPARAPARRHGRDGSAHGDGRLHGGGAALP